MTLYFPDQTRIERWLEQIGRPRAYYVGESPVQHSSQRAVAEPLWRSLRRKPGLPPPPGWCFRIVDSFAHSQDAD